MGSSNTCKDFPYTRLQRDCSWCGIILSADSPVSCLTCLALTLVTWLPLTLLLDYVTGPWTESLDCLLSLLLDLAQDLGAFVSDPAVTGTCLPPSGQNTLWFALGSGCGVLGSDNGGKQPPLLLYPALLAPAVLPVPWLLCTLGLGC